MSIGAIVVLAIVAISLIACVVVGVLDAKKQK